MESVQSVQKLTSPQQYFRLNLDIVVLTDASANLMYLCLYIVTLEILNTITKNKLKKPTRYITNVYTGCVGEGGGLLNKWF